jgi:hypothetical protein
MSDWCTYVSEYIQCDDCIDKLSRILPNSLTNGKIVAGYIDGYKSDFRIKYEEIIFESLCHGIEFSFYDSFTSGNESCIFFPSKERECTRKTEYENQKRLSLKEYRIQSENIKRDIEYEKRVELLKAQPSTIIIGTGENPFQGQFNHLKN